MKVPFVDLAGQYKELKKDIDKVMQSVCRNAEFVGGSALKEFESSFAKYLGVNHCIGCANGTDALEISLKALGVKPGDEVIVPALTWISTSEAVSFVGAKIVFVDVHPTQHTIDPKEIELKINSKTKGIIPVHLYGMMADMEAIRKIANEHNLFILEDCAQAHGALFKNKKAGSIGDISTFSFYPAKNLGAFGDGGAICSNNKELIEKCRLLANHGQQGKHNHVAEGRNSRLDNLQAAVLNIKLPHLDRWNALRRKAAEYYDKHLKEAGIKPPQTYKSRYHVYHLYTVDIPNRNEALEYLKDKGVGVAVHYPTALPFLPAYSSYQHWPVEFPESYRWSASCISLPMFPGITEKQQDHVIKHLTDWEKMQAK